MSRKLLLVDDTEVVLRLEKMLLRKTGFELLTAADGVEALKLTAEEKPAAVLLDLMMPEMSGDAVCRQIKSRPDLRDTVVIMITSKGDDETRKRCEMAGCDHFLTKPIEPEQLNNILRML